jgi:hypothetical protein
MATPRLAESGSRQLSDSLSRGVSDLRRRRVADCEYLREFEAKSGMAQKVVRDL